jgi:hypothetical protein
VGGGLVDPAARPRHPPELHPQPPGIAPLAAPVEHPRRTHEQAPRRRMPSPRLERGRAPARARDPRADPKPPAPG